MNYLFEMKLFVFCRKYLNYMSGDLVVLIPGSIYTVTWGTKTSMYLYL